MTLGVDDCPAPLLANRRQVGPLSCSRGTKSGMMNGVGKAHRRADCALVGAVALIAVSGVMAREVTLYTDELRARAALPDRVAVTESPIAAANLEHAAQSECLAEAMYYEARGEGLAGEKAVAE